MQADSFVQQAISLIDRQLAQSAATLKSAGQQTTLNIDEVVEKLNRAKADWLQHMSGVFDSAILKLKNNLTSLK